MSREDTFGRNKTEIFAERVYKNLRFIMEGKQKADVHEVTQLAVSLLGLVVLPWERGALEELESRSLSDCEPEKWGKWNICKNNAENTVTLGDLFRHIRNAVAHGRINFSSDAEEMDKVDITFWDCKHKNSCPYWEASINGAELRKFCERALNFLMEKTR